MVLSINTSCSKNKSEDLPITVKKNTVFFVNDTIQNIFESILSENKDSKGMTVELFDDKEHTILMFDMLDSIFDCDKFNGMKYYDGSRIFFINNSKKMNFENIIELDKNISKDSCNKYLLRNQKIIVDTKIYLYRIDEGKKLHYYNGNDLIFKNGQIKLR